VTPRRRESTPGSESISRPSTTNSIEAARPPPDRVRRADPAPPLVNPQSTASAKSAPTRCDCSRNRPRLRKSVIWWGDQRALFRNLGVLGAETRMPGTRWSPHRSPRLRRRISSGRDRLAPGSGPGRSWPLGYSGVGGTSTAWPPAADRQRSRGSVATDCNCDCGGGMSLLLRFAIARVICVRIRSVVGRRRRAAAASLASRRTRAGRRSGSKEGDERRLQRRRLATAYQVRLDADSSGQRSSTGSSVVCSAGPASQTRSAPPDARRIDPIIPRSPPTLPPSSPAFCALPCVPHCRPRHRTAPHRHRHRHRHHTDSGSPPRYLNAAERRFQKAPEWSHRASMRMHPECRKR
jgi:hypothetical protein